MLEQKLQEELNRYKAINKYGKTMIMEQDAPPPTDPGAAPADPGAAPAGAPPPTDPGAAPAGAPPTDPGAPPTDPGAAAPLPSMDTTEELDITDLVDMVKSVKKGQEDSTGTHTEITTKMDDVFTKLNDLESKLGEMNQVIAKIDQLGQQVQQMKPQSPQEKLEMRSLDSYPFNEKPQEFFAHKQGEMQASGKNEYVLTKNDVQDYSNNMIKDTFNQPTHEEDEYKF
jgi:hypothetical protein